MKRFFLALGVVAVLAPLEASAQYGRGHDHGPEQLVQSWYRQFLRRNADPMASVWINQLAGGEEPESVLAQILSTDEYYARAGGNPAGFVRRLQLDLTGQPPRGDETRRWSHRMYASERQDIAYEMLRRYPQSWNAAAPGGYEEEPYDYRRPIYRYPRR